MELQPVLESVQSTQPNAWQQLIQSWQTIAMSQQGMPSLNEMVVQSWGEQLGTNVLHTVGSWVLHEWLAQSRTLVHIILLALLAAILHVLQKSFERTTVSTVAFSLSYLVILVLCVQNFTWVVTVARETVATMVHIMYALIPLLMTMLASIGHGLSASMLHPTVLFAVYGVNTAIMNVVFPVLLVAMGLQLVSMCSERFRLDRLAKWLQSMAMIGLMVVLAIFLGIISVQSVSGGVRDGLAIKAVKAVTGNAVPVVGRLLSDATDAVWAAVLLIKNGVGIVGIVLLTMACALPAIKVLVLAWMHQLAAALLQPFGDNPVVHGVRMMGNGMVLIAAVLGTVGLMFFLTITLVLVGANVGVMMR